MPTTTRVPAAVVQPLRTRVLRPSWTDRLATYPEDDRRTTIHLASYREGSVVAVATLYPEVPPAAHRGAIPEAAYAEGAAWRLRGMATAPLVRGAGYGAIVLSAGFDAVRDGGGSILWCNARRVAVPFYERMGLAVVGPEFEIEGIGPHHVMWRAE